MGSSANRWRAVVLLAWAAGLVALLVLGRYTLFIRAQLWPMLLGSLAIVMLFLWAMTVRPAERGRVAVAGWLRGGLLMLPLFYMVPMFLPGGLAASGLTSDALQTRDFGGDEDSMLAPAPSVAAPQRSPEKVLTLGYVHLHRRELVGQHVVMEGRVSKTDDMPKGRMVLYRFVIVCCAADAMPVQMTIFTPKADGLANDQWVRVGGQVINKTVGTRTLPVIEADEVMTIPAPSDPYLSAYKF